MPCHWSLTSLMSWLSCSGQGPSAPNSSVRGRHATSLRCFLLYREGNGLKPGLLALASGLQMTNASSAKLQLEHLSTGIDAPLPAPPKDGSGLMTKHALFWMLWSLTAAECSAPEALRPWSSKCHLPLVMILSHGLCSRLMTLTPLAGLGSSTGRSWTRLGCSPGGQASPLLLLTSRAA